MSDTLHRGDTGSAIVVSVVDQGTPVDYVSQADFPQAGRVYLFPEMQRQRTASLPPCWPQMIWVRPDAGPVQGQITLPDPSGGTCHLPSIRLVSPANWAAKS